MHQLSAVCVTLVIASVLVQNASAKRGCAAFGHACYGGHGKRSSAAVVPSYPEGFDPSTLALDVLPIPYSKLVLDKPRTMDALPDDLRSNDVYGLDTPVLNHRTIDSRGGELKYAIYAILRQLMEEASANHQDQSHQQQPAPQQPFPRDLPIVREAERK
ncbi:uncharacterized protein LOC131212394 [Anopheles bellator]|uniref:uncharacterized protein LOC131212394 n=1 Tax=Anopheles bellator TaxID=139047 RepID=UPI00264A2ACE|nr:uncharacterized protein LOC131212394 [Anopheles bellator]XP_058062227.1 uncharacterized protein LOC131212394 [Anopheles bellator]